ncbi:heavy-metal-associated domain-containing protein [Pseudonocardia acaciae]|uniref:heavy-metal-associated domain-containing protein n=1 Tax=Pseudonocardia acaciae TaxID=551276 RepID=UPI0004907FE9|nr:heavy-metal-associated domain-containing protein [Pseudonocardia acaciae]
MIVQAPYRTTVTVIGMSCEHCAQAVTDELSAVSGVRSVDVTVSSGFVTITSDRELGASEISAAVVEAGYGVAD